MIKTTRFEEEEIRRIIEESGVLAPYLNKMLPIPHYTLDSEQAVERYKRDVEAREKNNFRNSVFQCASDITTWVNGGCGGTYTSLQSMNSDAHKNAFSSFTFAQLDSNAKDLRQGNEEIKNAKLQLSKLTDAKAKAQWEKYYSITLETPNMAHSWIEHDWSKHEAKIGGKEAVLDMVMLQYEKILAVYDAEISDRKKSPKVKEIIKNMTALVREAEKIRPTIIKANEKAQRALVQGRPDLKTCNIYLEAITEFSELSSQYLNLKNELDFYTNQAIDIPDFPTLNQPDTSADHEIKKEWRKFA